MAAACILSLSDGKGISRELGTRHRAALGVTETTDAISLIVSEETGTISVRATAADPPSGPRGAGESAFVHLSSERNGAMVHLNGKNQAPERRRRMNAEPKKAAEQPRPSLRKALKGAPQRLWRLIYHNWPWKLLALFLALCLWAGLITQDPTLTRERVFTDVTVSVVGADTLRRNSGLIVLSGLEDENLTARLRVDVPQREYNTVTASNYNPRVDLTRITEAGEQTLRINTTSTSTYGTVRGISPETITVVVDQFVTNYRVPVSVNIIGEYPEGFYGTPISLDPSAVTLSGPKSLVDQISRVYVDFDVSRLAAKAGTVRTALPMRFVNADGDPVESDLLEVTSGGCGAAHHHRRAGPLPHPHGESVQRGTHGRQAR